MKRLLTAIIVVIASLGLVMPSLALAATNTAESEACQGIGAVTSGTPGTDGCKDTSGPSVEGIISTALNILSIVVGIAAVIMIIVSGLRFVLAGGDSAQITSARNSILYAVIGLTIAALAQVLVKFVLNKVNNSK